MGYATPTPIQEQVIEPLLNGSDIVGQAQTGTGKTAGFGIPIAEMVDPRDGHVQAIVLTPTRELARQVSDEVSSLCRTRGTMVVSVYGGARMGPQVSALENGAQVVVGTPGRVIDLIDRGVLRLDRVTDGRSRRGGSDAGHRLPPGDQAHTALDPDLTADRALHGHRPNDDQAFGLLLPADA